MLVNEKISLNHMLIFSFILSRIVLCNKAFIGYRYLYQLTGVYFLTNTSRYRKPAMKIKENSPQHLILTVAPWWGPVIGVIVAGFCFWVEPAPMTESPVVDKLIAIIVGLIFFGGFALAMRKTIIHFDRTAATITRTTEALLPLGSIYLFRSRSETRPIKPVSFAYAEKQKQSSNTAKSSYSLALATGTIPEDILIGQSAFIFAPEMDKVRWLVGYNAGMKKNKADEIIDTVNQWLSTKSPL